MKDAFGGILNLVLIVVFLLLIEGILGLVVNYSKAFRMKNTVISAIEILIITFVIKKVDLLRITILYIQLLLK